MGKVFASDGSYVILYDLLSVVSKIFIYSCCLVLKNSWNKSMGFYLLKIVLKTYNQGKDYI